MRYSLLEHAIAAKISFIIVPVSQMVASFTLFGLHAAKAMAAKDHLRKKSSVLLREKQEIVSSRNHRVR